MARQVIKQFWERCILDTMAVRTRCGVRPSLYYTEGGELVLRVYGSASERDRQLCSRVALCIDELAPLYGYERTEPCDGDGWYVWSGTGSTGAFTYDDGGHEVWS